MNCPHCGREMMVGSISQGKYILKWVPCDKNMGILNSTLLVKRAEPTSMMDRVGVKVFYCEECRKFLIDQGGLRVSN